VSVQECYMCLCKGALRGCVRVLYVAVQESPGYGVSARALAPYSGDLNHCRSCTPASEDGLKESPKDLRQK
jgi:hypothetical protein